MFETKVTRMLGIKYPIVGGTMMWITTPEFTADISNAGGLGVLASAIYKRGDEFEDAIDRIFALTDKPFAVNLNLFPSIAPVDNLEYLEILIRKGVKIVETSAMAPPQDLCDRIKEAGLIWIHKCVGVRHALKAQALGADVITAVGWENGGATGTLDIGTLALVPRIAESIDVPLIGGGGVSDGRGFLAILALGAEGVIIGTRLLATQEVPLHENLKRALLAASEVDTMLNMRTVGFTHRVWANAAAKKCAELEEKGSDLSAILDVSSGQRAKKMFEQGDLDAGIISCGQGIGLAHDMPTVKALLDRIISEAEGIAKRLAGNIKD